MTNPTFLFPEICFGQTGSLRPARFSSYTTQSIYLPMPDGVRLAADIFLPDPLTEGEKIPLLLYRTRYWRTAELKTPQTGADPILSFFTSYGYGVIKLDVRGTGASFGTVRHEWQPEDISDTTEVIEWIIAQPWSNGKVGSYGVSYPGTTAELLAATRHPAVTSIWATYHELDGFNDIAFPGGAPSRFLQAWSDSTQLLDKNQSPSGNPDILGVKPVDEDTDRSLLKAAVEDHRMNNPIGDLIRITYRDDPMNILGISFDAAAVFPRQLEIEANLVPLDIWGSWMDANTADTVIRHFTGFKNPVRGVISAWSHGGGSRHDPFLPVGSPMEINRPIQMQEILRYMDQHFQSVPGGLTERVLYYYTMGEQKWKKTSVWPPLNTHTLTLHLGPGNTLSPQPALNGGSDSYSVDFEASTGEQNRWWTEMGGGPVVYPDRAEADKKLLVYDSEPCEKDTEITGHPVITLYISSTESDGAFFVYLEDVDPDGKVTYITEGILRALHRKVSTEKPPFDVFGPYHSYKRQDGELLEPGSITELTWALMPTSALIRKGHRIRIAIAGADKDTFNPIPGEPVIQVYHGGAYPSRLELPVIVSDQESRHSVGHTLV